MASKILHRRVNIITLHPGESVAEQGQAGDIVLEQQDDGWWTHFISDDGEVQSYDTPAESYEKALWAAKAAAEFSSE